ncbi:MAG: isoprenyl transferase [Deltaproteobacteria bacterium]|nr:isoprenyl transferase [Deltaproteobacteria bacterium]
MNTRASRNPLYQDLDLGKLPRHVAIIMDGNGRWAQSRGLERLYGHRRGKASVKAIVELSRKIGIEYLSLYAFSSENWQRPAQEVKGLMNLLKRYLTTELDRMMKNGVRLQVIGNTRRLPSDVRQALRHSVESTKRNKDLTVILALSYSAREEIANAVRAVARRVRRGDLEPDDITEEVIAESLGTAGVPDPDLLIRTSGEVRLSNFLLWQVAYTEIYITETLWPDFREHEFIEALRQFQARERRFGRLPDQPEESVERPSDRAPLRVAR